MAKKSSAEKSSSLPLFLAAAIFAGSFLVYSLTRSGGSDSGAQVQLPDFATKSKKSVQAYTAAMQIPEVLEKIPCYCGCGAHSGHKSVKNCFLKDAGGYDDHGAYCDMCMDEVLESYAMHKRGASLKEIRNYIDQKYSKYGSPTPTPEV